MRYRFSPWDVAVGLMVAACLASAWWLMLAVEGPVPVHWGADGTPDRFGPLRWTSLLMLPLIMPLLYVPLRILDGISARRSPESYGFLTHVAGGIATLLAVLVAVFYLQMANPTLRISVVPPIGLFFIYLGWLLRTFEEVPINTGGFWADTPEVRAIVRATLSAGFMICGLAAVLLTLLLPKHLTMLALAPIVAGPMATLVVTMVRASAH